jgi:regulatory protein
VSSSSVNPRDDTDPFLVGDAPTENPLEPVQINPADIRFSAMNYLARREHTRQELHQKLMRRFPDSALVAEQIQRLSDQNLQSDARFAENFVLYRAGLGFGYRHVRQDMRQRGLNDAQIALAFDCAEINWVILAEKVYLKKFGESSPEDIKARAKRVRYMQYRGFGAEEYQHLF